MLSLVYYYCGIIGTISFTIIRCFKIFIEYVLKSIAAGLLHFLQQKLLCEQRIAANLIFDHATIVILIVSLLVNIILGVFAPELQTAWAPTDKTSYVTVMLRAIPTMMGFHQWTQFLLAENNSTLHSYLIVYRDLGGLLLIELLLQIYSGFGKTITLELFAYAEIATMAVFSLVVFIVFSGTESITQFKFSFSNLKNLKMGVIGVTMQYWIAHLGRKIPEVLPVLLTLISIYTQTVDVQEAVFAGFALYICFMHFNVRNEEVIGQVLIPNNQMKKYDRIVQIQIQGFLILLVVNSVINIIIFCAFSTFVRMIYFDVQYNTDTAKYSANTFSADDIAYVEYVAVDNILATVKTIVQTIERVTSLSEIEIASYVIQDVIIAALFVATYLVTTQNAIHLLFYAGLVPSITHAFSYVLIFFRFLKYRKHQAELDTGVDDIHREEEDHPVIKEPADVSTDSQMKEQVDVDKMQHIIEMKPMPLPNKFTGTSLFDPSKLDLSSRIDRSSKEKQEVVAPSVASAVTNPMEMFGKPDNKSSSNEQKQVGEPFDQK